MNESLNIKSCKKCLDRYLNTARYEGLKMRYPAVVNSEDCDECGKYPRVKRENKTRPGSWTNACMKKIVFFSFFFICLAIRLYFLYNPVSSSEENKNIENGILTLKLKYTSQKEALWSYVRKVLNDSTSPVHSLILLYKDDGDTAVKFARDLMSLINDNNDIGVTLEYEARKGIDHGGELVHYLNEVKKNKNLIVPKLEEVPVERVTMFHVLCDESMSQSKPLYYIFTLKDTSDVNRDSIKNQNPLEKAGGILRKAWMSLPGNELHPLISRIARHVIEILPENVNS